MIASKSGGLPFLDTRPGKSGLSAEPTILPIAGPLGTVPSPNARITNLANGLQSIDATLPNYNTFIGGDANLNPSSDMNIIFILNNNDGTFDLNDTIFCTFIAQF